MSVGLGFLYGLLHVYIFSFGLFFFMAVVA